jgi:hypothetical protein
MSGSPNQEPGLDLGTPGASARREHERRRSNREARTRQKHPRIGNLLLRVRDAPTHETQWARGASGEETVAASLAKRCGPDVVVLHDRAVAGSRANIDHIAVCPTGIYVIDSKRYKGRVTVSRPLFGQEQLTIAGRDKTKLIDSLEKQVEFVKSVVATTELDVPVRGVLCFVDGGIPVLGKTTMRGFELLYPRRLAKRLNAKGPLRDDQMRSIAGKLAPRFPAA